ncbi:MAG TPA: DUF5017 domain-containing protein [Candidatus Alistipes intestinipullorum]|nr:DUF5017 domain-containing protein [Candidatus Alistipes intestinipullorum]
MKSVLKYIFGVILLSITGCQKDEVVMPTLEVTTDKTVYKVGEEVVFRFSGYADFLTIFTGVDNYTAGSVQGTFKGSRYIYRERVSEPGQSILSFNCRKDNVNTLNNAELRLLISADFNGDVNSMDAIHAATWTDITDRATWPDASTASGKNIASGNIDLSEWNGQLIYVALKYTAGAGADQYGWTLSSFTLKNTIPTDSNPFVIWNNGSAPKFGTMTNQLQDDGINPRYAWTLGTSLVCKGGSGTDTSDLESWLISSPVDPAKVDPDYGTIIKSYSQVVPDSWSYTYWKEGEFTVNVVARNATKDGEKESVKELKIKVEETGE